MIGACKSGEPKRGEKDFKLAIIHYEEQFMPVHWLTFVFNCILYVFSYIIKNKSFCKYGGIFTFGAAGLCCGLQIFLPPIGSLPGDWTTHSRTAEGKTHVSI